MSFASKYNKNGHVFSINTEGWNDYFELSYLHEKDKDAVYPVHGFYVNRKSKFGPRPVLISDGYFVNLPSHMLSDVVDIMGDPEAIADIEAGKVGFKVRTYTSKTYNKECFGVEFVDVE